MKTGNSLAMLIEKCTAMNVRLVMMVEQLVMTAMRWTDYDHSKTVNN